MKVLAIGATGFIGRHVVPLLVEQGIEVAVLHRDETGADLPAGVRRIRGNRNRLDHAKAELERFAPDVVLDAILYTEQQAREVVEAFRGNTGRLVALSSADVYRNYDGFRGKSAAQPDAVPLAEDAPLRETRYPYRGSGLPFEHADDYEKVLVEQVLLTESDLPATLLRLPAVYGPGDAQHRLRPYLQRMVDGRPGILLQEEQAAWRWTRSYVGNVAAAIALAVADARTARRVFNLGDEPVLSERKWVERIGAAAGWRGGVVAVSASELPNHLKQPFDWRYELWTDTSSIREELGYVELIPLDEALESTVEWERSTLHGTEPLNYGEEDAVLQSKLNQ
jgi:nucleoside-diphosphate-sugar epimerase